MGFSNKNTGVGFHSLLQGVFPTQGSNSGFLHCQTDSLLSEPPGKPHVGEWIHVHVWLSPFPHFPPETITTSVISYQSVSSVTQSCPTLCNPVECSTPGFPVHHQLPELAQTYVLRVSDAIPTIYLLSSPSPFAFNLFQHQGLFQ